MGILETIVTYIVIAILGLLFAIMVMFIIYCIKDQLKIKTKIKIKLTELNRYYELKEYFIELKFKKYKTKELIINTIKLERYFQKKVGKYNGGIIKSQNINNIETFQGVNR